MGEGIVGASDIMETSPLTSVVATDAVLLRGIVKPSIALYRRTIVSRPQTGAKLGSATTAVMWYFRV